MVGLKSSQALKHDAARRGDRSQSSPSGARKRGGRLDHAGPDSGSRECVGNRSRSEDGSPSVRRSQGDLRLRGRNRCPAAVTMSWCQAASGHARRRIENRRRHAGDVPPDGLDRRCARTALGRGRRLAGQSAGLRSRNDHGGHSAWSRRSTRPPEVGRGETGPRDTCCPPRVARGPPWRSVSGRK